MAQKIGTFKYRLNETVKEGIATGIVFEESSKACIPCIEGKQTRTSYKTKKSRRAENILELVHFDLCE